MQDSDAEHQGRLATHEPGGTRGGRKPLGNALTRNRDGRRRTGNVGAEDVGRGAQYRILGSSTT